MAVTPRYIAHKSALARLRHPQVSAVLAPRMLAGEVATCGVIELEIPYSARSYADLRTTRATRSRAFPLVPMTQADFDRALDVMEELARRGQHRTRSAGQPPHPWNRYIRSSPRPYGRQDDAVVPATPFLVACRAAWVVLPIFASFAANGQT